MAAQAELLDQALGDMRDMLAEDGYALNWHLDGPTFVVDISATANACADCLVPKAIMSVLVNEALDRVNVGIDKAAIRLVYPTDPIN